MRAADAIIAWTPAEHAETALRSSHRATAGTVAVLPWRDADRRADDFARIAGACDAGWRSATGERLVTAIFVLFNTMVLRDGVAPLTAHINLLDLDEYRESLAADLCPRARPVRPPANVIDLLAVRSVRFAPDTSFVPE